MVPDGHGQFLGSWPWQKRESDGPGRSFGSWPQQKGCLMAMTDPLDLGHGKKDAGWSWPIHWILPLQKLLGILIVCIPN